MDRTFSPSIQARINKLKISYGNESFEKKQKDFLRRFVLEQRQNIALFLFFSFLETFCTILIAVLFNSYFEKYLEFLPLNKSLIIVVIVFLIVAFYLILNYVVLRLAQGITYDLYNRVRRAWYKKALDRSVISKPISGGNLFPKIIYHSQLLKMGVEKVLIDGVKAVFLYVTLLVVSFFFNSSLFSLFIFSFPFLLMVFAACWYLGRYYISREQTLNVKIIRHIFSTLINRKNILSLNLEQKWGRTMNGLLELDTYFRQRREIWFKMSDRFIWGFFIIMGVSIYFIQAILPVTFFYGWVDMAITGLLVAFFTKTVYHIVNVGLFFQPLLLGLKIAVPNFSIKANRPQKQIAKNFNIIFKGQKTKISRFGGYHRPFKLVIKGGNRILIYGSGVIGKSTLGQLIAGQRVIKSLNVKVGNQTISAINWPKYEIKRFFVSNDKPNSLSELQFITGSPETEVSGEKMHYISKELSRYEFLKPIVEHPEFPAKKIYSETISNYEWLLLNMAHIILNPYNIVVFDHSIVDINNEAFAKAFNELSKVRPDCAYVIFSSNNNLNLGNVSKYILTENNLEQIQ
jgi:hypothetical protein